MLLSELYVNVSAHTAPTTQPTIQGLVSNEQTTLVRVSLPFPAIVLLVVDDLDIFCISSLPSVLENAQCS